MEEVAQISDEIPQEELARRKDLSDMTIVTIDGEDAKDLDDAVSIEKQENSGYRLGVHIADVSYYVKENSELDREALRRGTSVYLVDSVVPMLPKKLSNGLCSLNPNKIRLTLSCFMEIDGNGAVLDYSIEETFIKSAARMTYKQVREILDGDMATRTQFSKLVPTFELMRELSLILRDKRARRGSIDFDFPEPKVITNDEGVAVDIRIAENTIANRIIEEFMLVANETVARHMHSLELPLVYRVHEPPSEEKVQRFVTLVRNLNYKFKAKKDVSPKAMQNLLFKIKDTPHQVLLSTMMLRSLMKARYSHENLGHYGLAAPYYCHFTSPIRRYPDLMVHRILHEWIKGSLDERRIALYTKVTQEAAKHSSDAEVAATDAERQWVDYKACEYMESLVGNEFVGFISSVTSFGLFVQLPNTVEGLVRMVDLADDYYEYDEENMILFGRRTGREYHIGAPMRVRLAKVNKDLGQIDFVPVEATAKYEEVESDDGRKTKKTKKSSGKGQKRRSRKTRRSK
jgi:ribonuclease R